jgi:predicted permease
MRPDHWFYTIPARLRSLFRRTQADQELDEELRDHIERKTEEYVAKGLPLKEARRQALLEMGGIEKRKEQCRDKRHVTWIHDLIQDLRFGLRMLRKSPGFTAVAVLTLALGIGANTAIFSLVDDLVLRPLPVAQPNQIAILFSTSHAIGIGTRFTYQDFLTIQTQTSEIFSSSLAALINNTDGVSLSGKSHPMWAAYVSGNFFELLGVRPALGRLLLPSEGKVMGADPVLVISYSYWKSRFNSDPSIIGQRASVNGHPVTIIGVTPQGFHGLSNLIDVQGYMPLAMAATFGDAPDNMLADTKDSSFIIISRLKPGVSFQQAQAAIQVIAPRLKDQDHGQATMHAVYLGPAGLTIDPTNPGILDAIGALFLTLAGCLLCLACMNITNLCLARAASRRHEVAMRAALGASRGRLIRQLLTESLLLAGLGCIAGVVLGILGANLMASISFHESVLPMVFDFRFDWRVFAYALAAAAFTTILVGIAPVLRAARGNANEILHDGGRTSTDRRQRLRATLVVAQVGSSLMLLIVAGLFVRSLDKAQHADLGFDPNHVLDATVDAHEAGYNENQTREFQKILLERARALPGVQSASLVGTVPMDYGSDGAFLASVDDYHIAPGEKAPFAGYNRISPGYFATVRIPLLLGRDIRDSDGANSRRVAVVNQRFVDQFWHGQNPVGRHFTTKDDPNHPIEVVGVAKNSREEDMFEQDPFFYVPLSQDYSPVTTLQLRTSSTPDALAPEVMGLIHSLEPVMPVFDVQPMTAALDTANGFLLFQFAAAVASALGLIGLILAIVGVYGVISYSARQRTHEIGIRMALGAQRSHVLKMVLGQGFVILGIGIIAGVLAAAALARVVGNLLFGIAALDPLTYFAASLILAAVALLACYIPARRAMRIDPMVALRYE